jgi:hypothetical protein
MTEEIQRAGNAEENSTPTPHNRVRFLWKHAGLALVIAAASDALGVLVDLFPPVQWALDVATAVALFLILGRRWALLPALAAEAIPGLGIFPFWTLVVVSIALYDDVKAPKSR